MNEAEELGLSARALDREDDGADLHFYKPLRFVTHIDEGAVAVLSDYYRNSIPAGGRVLDLMSSWVSHLPKDVACDMVGHGMKGDELAANLRLSRWFVQDLNREPMLHEPYASFDAVLVCVGVHAPHRLMDDRPFVGFGGHVIRRRADHPHASNG